MGRWAALTLTLTVLALAGWLSPGPARADSLRFFVDYGYNSTESETRTAEGLTTTSESDGFSQEYRLLFDKTLYPYLTLRGGGSFARTDIAAESDGEESNSTNIRKNPFLDLVLNSPMITAGLGVNRSQDEQRGNDGQATLLTRDMYTGSLGWRPVDLPSLNLRTTRTETYDQERTNMNTLQEQFQVSSRYQPHKTTDLSYSGNVDRSEDFLSDIRSEVISHSGRIGYADRFLKNRVNLSSTYSVNHRTTEVVSGAGGEFDEFVPILDLESYLEDQGVLNPRQPLDPLNPIFPVGSPAGTTIDETLIFPVTSPPPPAARLHIALDFGQIVTANVVRLRLDRELPAGLTAASFDWKVFGVDANNEWQEIALQSALFSSAFGIFQIELRFAPRTGQYLKAVATPRTLAGAAPVKITAVEILSRQAIAAGVTKNWQTSQMYNLATRVRLLENPGLDYNLSLFYRLSDPGSIYQLFVSNGTSLRHRLSPWLTGNALFARDDSMASGETDEDVSYRYGAGLTAVPLPTLSSSLNYSGRSSLQEGERSEQNSFSLNNRAVLYPGLDLLLGGSLSFATLPGGVESESSQISTGLSIVPHRTMSWNFLGSLDRSTRSGGDRPESTSKNIRGQASVSYSPVPALSIFAARDVVLRDDDRQTLQNYGVSWSPFREGTLQVGLAYFETLRPEDEARDRVFSPSLTWQIRQATFLDFSYAQVDSTTLREETESTSFNVRLRAVF